MNRSSRLTLICIVVFATRSVFAASDFGWRVSSCVRWLQATTAAKLDRTPAYLPTRHNRRVLRNVQSAQAFEVMRHGVEHSQLTRYVSVLPELTELFQKSRPDWNRLYFVINSGGDFLYADNGRDRTIYPPYEVLAVWRDSHLVFKTLPGAILEQLLLRRTPEKALMRAIAQIKIDLD